MKIISKYLLLIITAFIVSCTSKSKKVPTTLFNIENLNNINVNSLNDSNLNSQGYNRIVVDMLVYEQKIKDTVVQLEFDMDKGFVRTKNWRVELDNHDENYVQNFLQEKYQVISLNSSNIKDSVNKAYSFSTIRHTDNNIFLCHVNEEEGKYYLNVVYYNPVNKKK